MDAKPSNTINYGFNRTPLLPAKPHIILGLGKWVKGRVSLDFAYEVQKQCTRNKNIKVNNKQEFEN